MEDDIKMALNGTGGIAQCFSSFVRPRPGKFFF